MKWVNFNAVWERRWLSRGSNLQPYAQQARDLVLHLANDSSWLRSSGILVPRYSCPDVESLRDLQAVAFFVVWLASDQQPELNSSKRQCPTAWVTARRYRARFHWKILWLTYTSTRLWDSNSFAALNLCSGQQKYEKWVSLTGSLFTD